MGSKYGTITIRKHALVMFRNTQCRFLLLAFKLVSEFSLLARSEIACVPIVFYYSNFSLKHKPVIELNSSTEC